MAISLKFCSDDRNPKVGVAAPSKIFCNFVGCGGYICLPTLTYPLDHNKRAVHFENLVGKLIRLENENIDHCPYDLYNVMVLANPFRIKVNEAADPSCSKHKRGLRGRLLARPPNKALVTAVYRVQGGHTPLMVFRKPALD